MSSRFHAVARSFRASNLRPSVVTVSRPSAYFGAVHSSPFASPSCSFSSYASKPLIEVDVTKPATQQPTKLHNRWHPDIPAIASVRPGSIFRVQCLDWTGGQIHNSDSADDIHSVDLTQVHYLSGPIHVEGARPGDVLVVDLLDIGALPQQMWGFTGLFSRDNGGGFLTDLYPNARKAIWDFKGIYATSRHIHGVKFAGLTHPGLIGCAPSAALLQKWNVRERALLQRTGHVTPPTVCPPTATGAMLGACGHHQNQAAERHTMYDSMVTEAARTVPPREHGGNCDIKNLSRGSRIYFPVYVDGAKLSMGDIHFSQGDGEISFCGAIEMAGWLDLHVDIIRDGISKMQLTNPIFRPGPVEPRYSNFLTFEGVSVNHDTNEQHYLDVNLAYRNACINAIRYLTRFGYTEEQAYILLGTVPVEGRISGIVDIPNACATLSLPTDVFEFDISPEALAAGKTTKEQRGGLAKPATDTYFKEGGGGAGDVGDQSP